MGTQQSGSLLLDVGTDRLRTVLLDPGRYPAWNPAFRALEAAGPAVAGHRYVLSVRPGLRGKFWYTSIEPGNIATRWEVPGFAEFGTWAWTQEGTRTLLVHRFEHSGPLAAALAPAYRGVADLRLRRLATYLEQLIPPTA